MVLEQYIKWLDLEDEHFDVSIIQAGLLKYICPSRQIKFCDFFSFFDTPLI